MSKEPVQCKRCEAWLPGEKYPYHQQYMCPKRPSLTRNVPRYGNCALPGCGARFLMKKGTHKYCHPAHSPNGSRSPPREAGPAPAMPLQPKDTAYGTCALETCGALFEKKHRGHLYCTPAHSPHGGRLPVPVSRASKEAADMAPIERSAESYRREADAVPLLTREASYALWGRCLGVEFH